MQLLQSVINRLGKGASLHLIQDADHSFHVAARTGRKDADVRGEMLDTFVRWTSDVVASGRSD
jgi:hypothetical protein